MAVVEQEVSAAPPQPRPRPVWLQWIVLAASLLGPVLEGFLFGEEDPEKYRPFAPGTRKDGTK
jgi:hypothetical protein